MKLVRPGDASAPQISEERDAQNKRLIAHSLMSAITRDGRLTQEQERLIEQATPQERQAYVKRKVHRYSLVVLCLVAFFGWNALQPPKPLPPQPVIEITDAGAVKEIQLHETTFSTSSTVTTSIGIYQVRGGVSASTGDAVRIEAKERGQYSPATRSLCVKSTIKSACYPLL